MISNNVMWQHLLFFLDNVPKEEFQTFPGEETQNHRIFEAGRTPLEIVLSDPLLKQGQLWQIARDCIQLGFEYLQKWRLHHVPRQSIPEFDHCHSKKMFSCVQMRFNVYSVCAHRVLSCHWAPLCRI